MDDAVANKVVEIAVEGGLAHAATLGRPVGEKFFELLRARLLRAFHEARSHLVREVEAGASAERARESFHQHLRRSGAEAARDAWHHPIEEHP